MKLRLIATIVTGATAAMLGSAAFGQANPQNSGYVLFGYGTPMPTSWRSGSYGGKPGVNDTPVLAYRLLDPGHGHRRVRSRSRSEAARAGSGR